LELTSALSSHCRLKILLTCVTLQAYLLSSWRMLCLSDICHAWSRWLYASYLIGRIKNIDWVAYYGHYSVGQQTTVRLNHVKGWLNPFLNHYYSLWRALLSVLHWSRTSLMPCCLE
jgi:hypothetical protein